MYTILKITNSNKIIPQGSDEDPFNIAVTLTNLRQNNPGIRYQVHYKEPCYGIETIADSVDEVHKNLSSAAELLPMLGGA